MHRKKRSLDASGNPNTPDDDLIEIGPFAGRTVGYTKVVRKMK